MIKACNLEYTYPGPEGTPALQGVTFSMKQGEKIALMGANGSGKTTFIRCLNGLLTPTSGRIEVDSFSTAEPDEIFEIRRRVGMMFQNPDNQIVATTVEREIVFGLENLGLDRNEIKNRLQQALKKFHLIEYLDSPPHFLSGGERQRLALASVWVMQPDYLILDEPTSLLDPAGRLEVLRLLVDEMGDRKLGILLITQIAEEALECDRLVIMDAGKIIIDNAPELVFKNLQLIKGLGLDIPVSIELQMTLDAA